MRSRTGDAVEYRVVFSWIENPDSGRQFIVGIDALEQWLVMRAKLTSEPEKRSCLVFRHAELLHRRSGGDGFCRAFVRSFRRCGSVSVRTVEVRGAPQGSDPKSARRSGDFERRLMIMDGSEQRSPSRGIGSILIA